LMPIMTVAASSAEDKFEGSHATDLRSTTPAQSAVTFSTASVLIGSSVYRARLVPKNARDRA